MIIYLRGEESLLAKEAINQLKEKFLSRNPDGIEIREVEGDQPSPNWADLAAVPLFSHSRLTIINRAALLSSASQKGLARFLINLPKTSVVVIWDSKPFLASSPLPALLAKERVIDVVLASEAERERWLVKRAVRYQLELTIAQAREMIRAVGKDIWALDTHLQALALGGDAVTGQPPFSPNMVFRLARQQNWVELAVQIGAAIRAGEPVELVIGALASALRGLARPCPEQVELLSDVDVGLKTGWLDQDGAAALLAAYLPHPAKKKLQWEEQWRGAG